MIYIKDNARARYITPYSTIDFKFTNLWNESIICLFYSYDDFKSSNYRARIRKIYKDTKGHYFIHQRSKVRIETI